MKQVLKEMLEHYFSENYPELVHQLNADVPFSTYLEDKMELISPLLDELLEQGKQDEEIISICMQEIILTMPPSKYWYISETLENEFPSEYEAFQALGVLKFTILNLVGHCEAAFEAFEFGPDTMDSRFLQYMVIAEIQDYFINQKMN